MDFGSDRRVYVYDAIADWESGQPIPPAHGDIMWSIAGWQFLWSLLVQIGLMLIAGPASATYNRAMQLHTPMGKWIVQYLGTPRSLPKYRRLLIVINVLQLLASLLGVSHWILKSYLHEEAEWTFYVDYILGSFYCFHYVLRAIKYGMGYSYFASPTAIIDVFTTVPMFIHTLIGTSWLNFQYLRMFMMLGAYEELEQYGVMDNVTHTVRRLIITCLRTLCLIFCFAGTIFYMEVLGDFPNFHDATIATGMGHISFYTMCYWMVTTISTVGYGDYSPTTFLSRTFTIIFIFSGVIFFSIETASMVEISQLEGSGMGSYKPSRKGGKHIVVVGGGVYSGSSLLVCFLKEMLDEEHGESSLDIVIMNPREVDAGMRNLLKEVWTDDRIHYLVGTCTNPADQERVRLASAEMAFVLPNAMAENHAWEDKMNTIKAMAIHRAYPHKALKLLCLCPEAEINAARMGMPPQLCLSMNRIKASMLAQTCLCPGWTTLVSNLFTSAGPESHVDKPVDCTSDDASWFDQFCHGEAFEVRGCVLKEAYLGQTFSSTAYRIYMEHNISLVGVQAGGQVLMNPSSVALKARMVVFALVQNKEQVALIAEPDVDWKMIYDQTSRAARSLCFTDLWDTNASNRSRLTGKQATRDPRMLQETDLPPIQNQKAPGALVQFSGGKQGLPPPTVSIDAKGLRSKTVDTRIESPVDPIALADKFAADGGHIVLLCCTSGLWQQVAAFIEPLRAPHLPNWDRVIVVAPDEVPELYKGNIRQVAFLEIEPSQASVFHSAGLGRAKRVVVLAGNPECTQLDMVDAEVVTVANSLENAIAAHTQNGSLTRELMVTYEFHDSCSVKLLMPVSVEIFKGPDTDESDLTSPRAVMTNAMMNAKDAFVPEMVQDLPDFSKMLRPEEAHDGWDGSLNYDPRYVSGGLYFGSGCGSLMAMTYFTPGIEDVVLALLTPSATGLSTPFQVDCSLFSGRTYGELFEEISTGAVCHAALAKLKAQPTLAHDTGGSKWKSGMQKIVKYDLANTAVGKEMRHVMSLEDLEKVSQDTPTAFSSLPIGIYRTANVRDSELGYVMTAPPPDLKLTENDKLYLLATTPFAHLFTRLSEANTALKKTNWSNVPCLAKCVGLNQPSGLLGDVETDAHMFGDVVEAARARDNITKVSPQGLSPQGSLPPQMGESLGTPPGVNVPLVQSEPESTAYDHPTGAAEIPGVVASQSQVQ